MAYAAPEWSLNNFLSLNFNRFNFFRVVLGFQGKKMFRKYKECLYTLGSILTVSLSIDFLQYEPIYSVH